MEIRQIARVAIYTAITCTVAIAFRYAPSTYIPYSMLPVMVLLAGFVLGPKLGAMSMALYALLGLMGVPVFAKGGGITYILTPSFGFVLGYIFAAYAVGKVLELNKCSGFLWRALAVLVGLACLYLVGLSYFYVIINFYMHKGYSIITVLRLGFLPFIVLDLVRGVGVVILGGLIRKSLQSAGLTAI